MSESNENIDQQANAQQKQEAIREQMLKVLLTTEARERLANIKMVKPDVAKMIEDQIIQLASSGKINKTVTDEEINSYF